MGTLSASMFGWGKVRVEFEGLRVQRVFGSILGLGIGFGVWIQGWGVGPSGWVRGLRGHQVSSFRAQWLGFRGCRV